jgi:hypothetical protein
MSPPQLFLLAMFVPAILWGLSERSRRRIAERENKRLRSQLVDHVCRPINEIEHRLALRKELRAQGFQLHRRRA